MLFRSRYPTDKDLVFDLDEDIDLESPFLRGMLSDAPPSLAPERDAAPAVVTAGSVHMEMRDSEPTEDDWENM